MAFVGQLGFGEIIDRGERAANELPDELVSRGFSLGVVPAQKLAQTVRAREVLLFYSCVPVSEFGPWPAPAACGGRSTEWMPTRSSSTKATSTPPVVVESAEDAELFLYPGDQHYFADSSLPSYDPDATALLTRRVLDFLDRLD